MAWNEPGGGNGPRDPWGNQNKGGPPDLDEVLRNLQRKLQTLLGGKGGGQGSGPSPKLGMPIGFGLLLLAAFALYNSVYIVDPAERGVITRFGAFNRSTQPGPHLKLPWPIESMVKVNVDRNNSIPLGKSAELAVLTGDENVVLVEMTVQYKLKNAEDYLYRVDQPDRTLAQIAEAALRESIGQNNMDFIINEGRQAIAVQTEAKIQERLDSYNTGIVLTNVNFERAQPPEQVQDAFSDATRAREDKEGVINLAEAYANKVLPEARGAATQIIEDAKADYASKVRAAEGATSRFTQLLAEYQIAPEITRERLYIEAMEQVLASTPKVMLDTGGDRGPLSYLPLDMVRRHNAGADQMVMDNSERGRSYRQDAGADRSNVDSYVAPTQKEGFADRSRSRLRGVE